MLIYNTIEEVLRRARMHAPAIVGYYFEEFRVNWALMVPENVNHGVVQVMHLTDREAEPHWLVKDSEILSIWDDIVRNS